MNLIFGSFLFSFILWAITATLVEIAATKMKRRDVEDGVVLEEEKQNGS